MRDIRDEKNELPADFDQWLNRWALESMGVMALDSRLGILEKTRSKEAEHILKVHFWEIFVVYFMIRIFYYTVHA